MNIFFAMVPDASGNPSPAFFLSKSMAPKGAVSITEKRHAALLDAQADGKRIALGKGGKPKIVTARVNVQQRREELAAAIQREAARRIDDVSPLWRQLNDSRSHSPAGERRFGRIDAIREASNTLQDALSKATAAQLDEFPVRTHPFWPEFN